MHPNIDVSIDASIQQIENFEIDDPEVAGDVRSWSPDVRKEAVREALWVGVVMMSQIEATHIQRRYTMLLDELDRQVGRELF